MTKKRLSTALLFLLLLSLLFTSCSPANITKVTGGLQQNAHDVSLEPSMEIPEDGIVPAAVFTQLKEENAVIVFTGTTASGTEYQWTVFGSDIAEPKDLNLKISIEDISTPSASLSTDPVAAATDETQDSEKDSVPQEELALTFSSTEEFGFQPVLSIYHPTLWTSRTATVARQQGDTLTPVSGATITTTDQKNVFNFSVPEPTGNYLIIGDNPVAAPDDSNASPTAPDDAEVTEQTEPSQSETFDSGEVYTNEDADGSSYLATPKSASGSASGGKQAENKKSTKKSSTSGAGELDKYKTEPTPPGRPKPVEPEDTTVNKGSSFTVTISIDCMTILNNLEDLNPSKLELVPKDGIILSATSVTAYEGESVFDVLQRAVSSQGIHMEYSWTADFNSVYIEGLNNLYEFDGGNLSGWMYEVNGWYPNYGASRYQVHSGDNIQWRYTCDLGRDVGSDWEMQ